MVKKQSSKVVTYILTVDSDTGEVLRTQFENDDGTREDVEVEFGGTPLATPAIAFGPTEIGQQPQSFQIPGFTPSVVILVGGGAISQPIVQPVAAEKSPVLARTRPPAHIAAVNKGNKGNKE
jgi:hypothetical protein